MKNIFEEKSIGKLFMEMIVLFFIFVIGGMILLIGVYALPTDEMKRNVARSSAMFDYEGVYPQTVTGYKSSQLDNYTDTLMLANAIYPGSSNIIRDAVLITRIEYPDMSMPLSLTSYANDVKAEYYEIGYPRYWHGYLTVLKPLLLFFDVGDIRIINMICQAFVIFAVIALIWEVKGKKYAIAFLMVILLWNPVSLSLSLQYSSVFYITMITLLIVWKQPGIFQGTNRFYYYLLMFFIIGMSTSYFDLLTYPLVTLGLPLISILLLEGKTDDKNWKQQLQLVALACIVWGGGYVGMWVGKAIIGGILTGEKIIAVILSRISYYAVIRDSAENETIAEGIWRSLRVLLRWPYVLGFGGCFAYFITGKLKYSSDGGGVLYGNGYR